MTAEVLLPKCLGKQAQERSDFKICLVSDGNALRRRREFVPKNIRLKGYTQSRSF